VVGVYIEIAPMPETLKLKLAVYSSFVCALIFFYYSRQTRSDVGPWLGSKRDKSI